VSRDTKKSEDLCNSCSVPSIMAVMPTSFLLCGFFSIAVYFFLSIKDGIFNGESSCFFYKNKTLVNQAVDYLLSVGVSDLK